MTETVDPKTGEVFELRTETRAIQAATPVQLSGLAWTRERIDLVKRTIIPQGCGDDEFSLFMEQCRRTGLDPLLKQCYMVERRARVYNRQTRQDDWVNKFEFQASEGGMASRAASFPDFRGIMGAAVYSGDELEINAATG